MDGASEPTKLNLMQQDNLCNPFSIGAQPQLMSSLPGQDVKLLQEGEEGEEGGDSGGQDTRQELQSEQTSEPTIVLMLPVTDEKLHYPDFDSKTNLVNRRNIVIHIIANIVSGKDYFDVNKVKEWALKSIELLKCLPPISKRNSSPNRNRHPSGYNSNSIARSVSKIYS